MEHSKKRFQFGLDLCVALLIVVVVVIVVTVPIPLATLMVFVAGQSNSHKLACTILRLAHCGAIQSCSIRKEEHKTAESAAKITVRSAKLLPACLPV